MIVEVTWVHADGSTQTDYYEAGRISIQMKQKRGRTETTGDIQLFDGRDQTGGVLYANVSRIRRGSAVPKDITEEKTDG